MVVARQRPATARGVVFLLLEDEVGTVNVIVPPPVYERHRLVVRTASFVLISGRLERRDGTTNVVAAAVDSLSRPDMPGAEVRHIEPPVERETGRSGGRAAEDGRAAVGSRRRDAGRAQLRQARAVSADARTVAEHMFRPAPSLVSRAMSSLSTRLVARLMDGLDLAIDFATLGEYGLEAARRRARPREGRRRGSCLAYTQGGAPPFDWEALAPARRSSLRHEEGPPLRVAL